MLTLAIVNKYVEEARTLLKAKGHIVPSFIDVKISNRMHRALGYAESTSIGYSIKISGKWYKHDSSSLRETVLHEVAHCVAHLATGKMLHDNAWKQCMHDMGLSAKIKGTKKELEDCGHSVTLDRIKLECSCGKIYNVTKTLYTRRMNKYGPKGLVCSCRQILKKVN
jgi:predicted SprT family Zn-dependent metalloprotease